MHMLSLPRNPVGIEITDIGLLPPLAVIFRRPFQCEECDSRPFVDPRVELIKQREQFPPPAAGPRIESEAFQFRAALGRPKLLPLPKALPHGPAV